MQLSVAHMAATLVADSKHWSKVVGWDLLQGSAGWAQSEMAQKFKEDLQRLSGGLQSKWSVTTCDMALVQQFSMQILLLLVGGCHVSCVRRLTAFLLHSPRSLDKQSVRGV